MKSEIKHIKGVVEEATGVTLDLKTRKREVVFARRMYYKILKESFKRMSLDSIGKTLGLKQNHATVLHQVNQFEFDYSQDKSFRKTYDSIKDRLNGIIAEPEISLEEQNLRLKIQVSDLKKDVESLREQLKEARSNNIKPRNQGTKVYASTDNMSTYTF